jgi:hypothetical protein
MNSYRSTVYIEILEGVQPDLTHSDFVGCLKQGIHRMKIIEYKKFTIYLPLILEKKKEIQKKMVVDSD